MAGIKMRRYLIRMPGLGNRLSRYADVLAFGIGIFQILYRFYAHPFQPISRQLTHKYITCGTVHG